MAAIPMSASVGTGSGARYLRTDTIAGFKLPRALLATLPLAPGLIGVRKPTHLLFWRHPVGIAAPQASTITVGRLPVPVTIG
jgi:hypothetical protein